MSKRSCAFELSRGVMHVQSDRKKSFCRGRRSGGALEDRPWIAMETLEPRMLLSSNMGLESEFVIDSVPAPAAIGVVATVPAPNSSEAPLLESPTEFSRVGPDGALIAASSDNVGQVSFFNPVESFEIDLAGGQSLTVLVQPDEMLQPTAQLIAPDGSVVGGGAAAFVGQHLKLQTLPVMSTGTYRVDVRGAGGSAGDFTAQFLLNTAVEDRPVSTVDDGGTDSSLEGLIDLGQFAFSPYGDGQDLVGSVEVQEEGAQVRVAGNAWKKIDLPSTITPNTVLAFDFHSNTQGEVHAIGFDNDDDVVNSNTHAFQLYGTQTDWPQSIQDFNDYHTDAPGVKHYRIPVGQFFTGEFQFLTFVNDHDVVDADSEGIYTNIQIFEDPVDFDGLAITSYGFDQDTPAASVVVEDDGSRLRMTGNAWKKIDMPTSITPNTILEFDFQSSVRGDIHAIGFDSDDDITNANTIAFQVYGTQTNWASSIQDFNNYDAVAPGFNHYRIPVGRFFTGDIQYLTLITDHDVPAANAQSVFSNIRLHNVLADIDVDGAQSLDGSFIPMGGSSQRGAVVGSLSTDGLETTVADSEDFESGSLDSQWFTRSSQPQGRIQLTGAFGAADGSNTAMLMDVTTGISNLNEAIWTVDLSEADEATLSFWHAEWNDEETPFVGTFTGSFNADGVAISDDGLTWHPVFMPSPQSAGVWQHFEVDLAAEADAVGMTLGAGFKVKFQQFDNVPLTTDGRGYDQISITTASASDDWYSFKLDQGESASLVLGRLGTAGDASIELFDSQGDFIGAGVEADNVEAVIPQVVAAEADTYFVRVSGTSTDYALVVTRNAAFEAEPNDDVTSSVGLSPTGTAIGHLNALSVRSLPGSGTTRVGPFDVVGSPLSLGFAVDGSFVGSSIGASHNTVEFLRHGAFLAAYSVAYNGGVFPNRSPESGSSFAVNLEDFSSGSKHEIRATGTITTGVDFQRVVKWNDGDNYALVTTTLTNNTNAVLNDVAILENHDPDPGGTFTTSNDVTSDGQLVTGAAGAGAMGLGSQDPRAVASAEQFRVNDPFSIINTPIDPNGTADDIAINLAFDLGDLPPGQSTIATLAMAFGSNHSQVEATYRAVASLTDEVTMAVDKQDYYRLAAAVGETITIRTTLPAAGPDELANHLDVALELIDPSGESVAFESSGTLTHFVTTAGDYTVRVLAENDAPGAYVLSASSNPGDLSGINNFQRLEPLGGLAYLSPDNSGFLASSKERDRFEFFLEGGQTLAAIATPDDPTVQLSLEVNGNVFTAPGPGRPVVMTPLVHGADGPAQLSIQGDSSTSYTLDIYRNVSLEAAVGDSGVSNPLSLDGSFIDLGLADSGRWAVIGSSDPLRLSGSIIDEPNDTIPQAILSGIDVASGSFSYSDTGQIGDNPNVSNNHDVDLIQVDLDAGDMIQVDIDARVLGSSLDSVLRLFDATGLEVAVNDDSDGLDSFIEYTATSAGTFYVGVSSYANFDYDPHIEGSGFGFSSGEYEIQIDVLPDTIDTAADEGSDLAVTTVTVFNQDFESGISANERLAGRFSVNSTNSALNNGTNMVGHPSNYGNNEYSYYELTVDLTDYVSATLQFDYSARMENHFDRFNIQASAGPINPPNDLLVPESGMNYENQGDVHRFELGRFAYDSNGSFQSDTAVFDLIDFVGGVVNLRFQFGSDSSVTREGINIDNVQITGEPAVDPEVDQYTLDLTGLAGQPIDVILAGQDGVDFSNASSVLLELLDTDGTTVLATAIPNPLAPDGGNYHQAILGFEVPASGIYPLRFTSRIQGDYGLVVTQSLTFDAEPNDDDNPTSTLRSLDDTGQALGFVPDDHVAELRSVTIDFESLPGPDGELGTPDDVPINAPQFFIEQPEQLTEQFASLGVHFIPNPSIQDVNEILDDDTFGFNPGSSPNILTSLGTVRDAVDAFFDFDVFEISAAIGISGSADRLVVYSDTALTNPIGSVEGTNSIVTITSASPIRGMRVEKVSGNIQPAIDDLRLNGNVVTDTFVSKVQAFDLTAGLFNGEVDEATTVLEVPPPVFTAYLPDGMTPEELASQLTPIVRAGPISDSDSTPTSLIITSEAEPNDSPTTANPIPLGFDDGEDAAVDVTGALAGSDVDFFQLELQAGDILGASVSGGASRLSFRDSSNVELMGSSQDATFIHPAASPLPGGGNAALSWVVNASGTYYVRVSNGSGAYTMNLRLFRPELETQDVGNHQVLFLDFDGATIDTAIFGGPGFRTLSPFSSFLSGWGLSASDENAVIDAVTAAVEENISADIRALGNNGDFDATGIPGHFDIEILNSRDHTDPFGQPNVSRVIIGGTIAESGISTLGIAQSIDVGNFETKESALVLLDLLSSPSGPDSINSIPMATGASKIDLIGEVVGDITSHEAGHFFGNWHTSNTNATDNVMDRGGNGVVDSAGVGPDGIFGTPDDVDVDFGNDVFTPVEGFSGIEDTLNNIAFGLSSGGVDLTQFGPTVVAIDPGDGATSDPDISAIEIEFSETITAESATDINNYDLLFAGPNGVFEGGANDDEQIRFVPIFDGDRVVQLQINPSDTPLNFGQYQLTIDGDSSIQDLDGNPLNSTTGPGGGSDHVHEFELVFELESAGDLYSITLEELDTLVLSTRTLFGQSSATSPENTLDPRLIVVGPSGQLIGMDDNSAPDGVNAQFSFFAAEAGQYLVQVIAEDGFGEYLLDSEIIKPLTVVLQSAQVTGSQTDVVSGFFDMHFEVPDGQAFELAAYNIELALNQTGSPISLVNAFEADNAIFPGQSPLVFPSPTPGEVLRVADNLPGIGQSNPILDGLELFRTQFDVAPGFVGTFELGVDLTITALFDDLGTRILPVRVVPGVINVIDPGPKVVDVLVSGSQWSDDVLEQIDPGRGIGFPIPAGSGDQLVTLPWVNIDQISIQFNEPVNAELGDLSLHGVNVARYSVRDFDYDASTHTATWTLDLPTQPDGIVGLGSDRLLIDLFEGVTDRAGNALDGEWVNPTTSFDPVVDTFPSGDNVSGGNFLFRFNVLPGNVDLPLTRLAGRPVVATSSVTANDTQLVQESQFQFPGDPDYSAFVDVNANGSIFGDDVVLTRNRESSALPVGEPHAADLSFTVSDEFVLTLDSVGLGNDGIEGQVSHFASPPFINGVTPPGSPFGIGWPAPQIKTVAAWEFAINDPDALDFLFANPSTVFDFQWNWTLFADLTSPDFGGTPASFTIKKQGTFADLFPPTGGWVPVTVEFAGRELDVFALIGIEAPSTPAFFEVGFIVLATEEEGMFFPPGTPDGTQAFVTRGSGAIAANPAAASSVGASILVAGLFSESGTAPAPSLTDETSMSVRAPHRAESGSSDVMAIGASRQLESRGRSGSMPARHARRVTRAYRLSQLSQPLPATYTTTTPASANDLLNVVAGGLDTLNLMRV